jgi:catechol 2,3-dioxygenase-like lactoylglutathione lyase family enzyme
VVAVVVAWESATALDPDLLEVDVSIEVADVDAAHARARADGLEIVRELRDEPWGNGRLFMRDPSGRTVNVASHI